MIGADNVKECSSNSINKHPSSIERLPSITTTPAAVFAKKVLVSGIVAAGLSLQLLPPLTTAAYSGDAAATATVVIEKIPLLTKRTSDLQQYADIARGFKLLRSVLLLYTERNRTTPLHQPMPCHSLSTDPLGSMNSMELVEGTP